MRKIYGASKAHKNLSCFANYILMYNCICLFKIIFSDIISGHTNFERKKNTFEIPTDKIFKYHNNNKLCQAYLFS